jgi:hypothetical protein
MYEKNAASKVLYDGSQYLSSKSLDRSNISEVEGKLNV